MNASQVIKKVRSEFPELSKLDVSSVASLEKSEDGWRVSVEAVERKAIPESMDLLGLYDVKVDEQANIVSFQRKRLRRRSEPSDN